MPAALIPILIQYGAPLALQLLQLLIPMVAPYITSFVASRMSLIPDKAKPALNAIIGAVIAGATGGNPIVGGFVAHVVRSGTTHELPVGTTAALQTLAPVAKPG